MPKVISGSILTPAEAVTSDVRARATRLAETARSLTPRASEAERRSMTAEAEGKPETAREARRFADSYANRALNYGERSRWTALVADVQAADVVPPCDAPFYLAVANRFKSRIPTKGRENAYLTLRHNLFTAPDNAGARAAYVRFAEDAVKAGYISAVPEAVIPNF